MKNKKIHLKLGRLVFYKNLSYGCIDMLNSMTGFAHKMREAPFGLITWELRATNHRFLDIQLRLPEELRSKEIELRTEIKMPKCKLNFKLKLKFQNFSFIAVVSTYRQVTVNRSDRHVTRPLAARKHRLAHRSLRVSWRGPTCHCDPTVRNS